MLKEWALCCLAPDHVTVQDHVQIHVEAPHPSQWHFLYWLCKNHDVENQSHSWQGIAISSIFNLSANSVRHDTTDLVNLFFKKMSHHK